MTAAGNKSAEEIKAAVEAAVPGASVTVIANPSPSAQHSLLLKPESALAVAVFLRDSELGLDYCSNVTGVDWPDKEIAEKVKVTKVVEAADGTKEEKVVEETVKRKEPGYLEAVYHLFSVKHGYGPVVLRMRTGNRMDQVSLPSLTPVWRGAEFQEREIFDLYGIVFTGHPDLRRILMWDEFEDHPMRRDYVDPDDYEYEPTPHDEVLKRAQEHQAKLAAQTGAAQ
ncbi:MAG TPA: NADH-quinone oxidoreductase subunit C [Acidobacteriaceae bacterium]|jgi:NADH-quinone oxidoreductase subunit C|nr:NADH-quinone oxidoreductase subunit C [Acidobacteriaceae bacterium]